MTYTVTCSGEGISSLFIDGKHHKSCRVENGLPQNAKLQSASFDKEKDIVTFIYDDGIGDDFHLHANPYFKRE